MVRREKGKLKVSWLRNILNRLLEAEGLKGVEISLYLTDDHTIKRLNKTYRGKDKPTDVLSFLFNEHVDRYRFLGEIVISVDTAERQAKEFGHSMQDEIKRLLVHGFVHLLGYDHELGKEEEKVFKEIEERLMGHL
ncbi:MAG: rRNA maturation RNase YbeY [Aquificaceae bacterium]|nr:rRNA maturation RNase YbeY [Aquificaceae bacterium]MCX8164462.1 rRNA maturation RNase YbeY [Aquificaceae bacterium]